MNLKKHISPEAFIAPALAELEIDTQDETLFRKFAEEYAGKIDALWADFLQEEAFERLMARRPTMRTLICHTPLSNRVKNAMKEANIETVCDMMQYSPDEMRRFRCLGEKSIREIVDYLERAKLV